MSTPIIWILIPLIIGIILFFIRRWYRITVLIGAIVALLLGLSAIVLPLNVLIKLGPVAFKINASINVLGRTLILDDQVSPLVALIYILAAFWFSAAFEARAGRMFVPIGLILIAIGIAALAVKPFLYAALFLELGVLITILLILPPGNHPGRGAIRYLIFQTFGTPFILMTGWLLAGVESSPGNLELVIQASVLLGFGFIFMLAIFPFHSWVPMIAEEAHPYAAGFIFFFLPLLVLLFGLNFIDQYAWLRQSEEVYVALRLAGVIMTCIAGFWAAFDRHLGRIMGFASLTGIGAMLLAVSTSPSMELFFAMQVPRALSLAVWALSLSILQRRAFKIQPTTINIDPNNHPQNTTPTPKESLRFENIHGLGRKMPLAATSVTLAALSFAGYPIAAGFPIFQAIWRNLAGQSTIYAVLALIGSLSIGIGCLRSLAALFIGKRIDSWELNEHWFSATFLIIGNLLILILGLFPQWILPYAAAISKIFSQITASPLAP